MVGISFVSWLATISTLSLMGAWSRTTELPKMLDPRAVPENRDPELREVVTEVMSRVIEGTASPFALIRRSDLARLKQAISEKEGHR